MKYKKNLFFILEKIEKKKIEKEMINIKNLYLKKKQNSEQLKLLINYQKEYLKKINSKMILGVDVHQWKNYQDFISILQVIIQDNTNKIKQNNKIIDNSLKKWSENKIQLTIWQHLSIINKQKILKTKKIQQEILNDNYSQLKFLTKGRSL